MKLDGRWKEFDEYMKNHTVKDGVWYFGVGESLIRYYIKKRGLAYKHLKNKPVIDIESGKIYSCSKEVAKILGCKHKHVINSINRGFRCYGLKLEYYKGV